MGINNRGGALFWATGIDNSGLKRDKEQAVGILKGFAKQVTGLDVFAGLGAAAAMAFAKMTKEAYAFSKEFQTSMKEVQTISRATQEDYEGMSNAIIKMSTEVPDSAVELSRALYEIVSAGYDGAEGLRILDAASRGAVAGVTTTTVAADGLTTILNAWKLKTTEVTKVNDTMFRTVELGKITYDELAGSIAQVAPLAAASGVSFEEVGAAISTLTKQGTPGAQAITQIRSAMVAMNEQLGMGWGETLTLQEGFQALADISKETGKQLNEVTGRVEGAMAVLAVTGKNAKGAAEDIASIANAAGAADRAFTIMVESADNQMKILGNNIKERMKQYGDFLVIGMGGIAKSVNDKMRENSEARDKAIIAGIKREIVILESELKTLDNPIDSFFFGKKRIEEKRKELQDQLKLITDDFIAAQDEMSSVSSEQDVTGKSYVNPVVYQKELAASKKAYDEYNMLVTNGFKKEAETFYFAQLEAGKNYREFLQNQLKDHEHDMEARKIIYLELSEIVQREAEAQRKAEEAAFIPMSKRLDALRKLSESANAGSATRVTTGEPQAKGTKTGNALSSDSFKAIFDAKTGIGEIQSKSERISRTWDNIITDITNPEAWGTAADAVGELSYIIGSTNQQMGELLSGASNIMGGVTSALTKGASPQAIMQGSMQAIAGVAQMFESASAYAKTFDDILQDMNRDLEKQQRILDLAARKGNADTAYQGNLYELNKQKEALEEYIKLQEYQIEIAKKLGFFGRLSTGTNLGKLEKELQSYRDQLDSVSVQIEDLGQSWTDFTAGLVTELDLADKIAEAFQEGKTSAEDFAGFVNDIMKDAVLEVFKASVLGPQLTKAQEYLASALNDKALTDSEVAQFQALFTTAAENSRVIWEKLTQGIDMGGQGTEDPNSLAGSIRASLTEETGSILAGTMNAIRLDTRDIRDIQLAAADTLLNIEANTANLNVMRQDLSSIKDSFQNLGK